MRSSCACTLVRVAWLGAIFVGCSDTTLNQATQPAITPTPVPVITQTIDWFPVTATPTQFPTRLLPTPTPFTRPSSGDLILQDDFSNKVLWQTLQSASGNVAYGTDELTLAIAQPKASLFSFRDKLTLDNFYLEIDANPSLCQDSDQFGVLFRVISAQNYYRYLMTCGGQLRLERLINAEASVVQDWTPAVGLASSVTNSYRLGVWASGGDLRFYVNGVFQFNHKEPTLPSGGIGVYGRSMKDNIVTINFSNLEIWQTGPAALTTPDRSRLITPTP